MRRLSSRSARRVWLVALAWLSTAGAVGAAVRLPYPPVAPLERGAYQARDLHSGERLWEESWVLRQETRARRPILQLEERGQGIRDGTAPVRWKLAMTIDLQDPAPWISSTRQVWDLAGQPMTVEGRMLDYGPGTGQIRVTDLRTHTDTARAVRVTAETITPEMLPVMLRVLPEAPGQQKHFDLVMHGGSVVGFQARIVGQERVEVPAGTYDCFKVELDPTGFAGFLARLLLPKIYLWQAVDAPHIWIKFQGPAAGPGSPEIVRELTAFQAVGSPAR